MKVHPQVIRMHHRTAPYWARLRRVLEKINKTNQPTQLDDTLKDVEILDKAVHMALTMLDPDPANADENSIILSLDAPIYISPEDGLPKGKAEPIPSRPPEEIVTARLDRLERNVKTIQGDVKTLKEKHE